MTKFNDHELIFLGSGGGRIHCVTQHRRTGGIIYKFNDSQVHIDPGPGAIVYLNELGVNRLKTKWIVVTHNHTDHNNDLPVIIESVHKKLHDPAGILISTKELISELNPYYKSLLLDIIEIVPGKSIKLTENTRVIGTKTIHGKSQGFGLIFEQFDPLNKNNSYKIAFTSDTEIYQDFSEEYEGVDILVANVLRPDDAHCSRHATVDEITPEIIKINPKTFIMTHIGAHMDSEWSKGNMVPQQVEKIQKIIQKKAKTNTKTNTKTRIIGASDSLKLEINDLLK